MSTEEQKRILLTLCNDVRDSLLANSDKWPASWDGTEMGWLLAKAVSMRERNSDGRSRRWRNFENEWITKNLI